MSHGRDHPSDRLAPGRNPAWGRFAAPARGGPKSAPPTPLLSQGGGARPPGHATCAPWESGVPGPARDLRRQPKALAGEKQKEKGREAGGGSGRNGGGGQLPWSTDPMARRGSQCPRLSAASLCIWRDGGSARGLRGLCGGRPGAWGAPSSLKHAQGAALAEAPASGPGAARLPPPGSRLPARRSRRGSALGLTREGTRLPSPRSVFIGFQCSKITGFPHCFLLFIQRHGNRWIPSISKTKGFPANFTLRNP